MFEDENLNLIPVTWIKQYYFCPRIVYFLGVLGYEERLTESMIEGKEFHVDEEKRVLHRKTLGGEKKEPVKTCISRLPAVSKRLNLYGVIDEIAETKEGLIVVENKWIKAPKKPHPGHLYQAAAYAMLAEEILGKPVRSIMIRYVRSNKSFKIPLTDEIRKHVIWVTSKIKSIIENEKLPKIRTTKKCKNCGFIKVCRGL